jgi:hypothetical protein
MLFRNIAVSPMRLGLGNSANGRWRARLGALGVRITDNRGPSGRRKEEE